MARADRPRTAEHQRLAAVDAPEGDLFEASEWYEWGPYLSERSWGTVREDYSADEDAWASFPHDHARSRAYRWNEDGLAGLSDLRQRLCLSLALWNGVDPILKERVFGLTGPEGNHGEDAKEYWWYLDAVPSHAWLRWRYHYPQRPFPYGDLVDENHRRGFHDPEYELLDTGIFDDDRYWSVEVTYAKADATDIAMRVVATNHGPEPAELHVLPTLWFRNTWAWDEATPRVEAPRLWVEGPAIRASHPTFGPYELLAHDAPDGELGVHHAVGVGPHPAGPDRVVEGLGLLGQERLYVAVVVGGRGLDGRAHERGHGLGRQEAAGLADAEHHRLEVTGGLEVGGVDQGWDGRVGGGDSDGPPAGRLQQDGPGGDAVAR